MDNQDTCNNARVDISSVKSNYQKKVHPADSRLNHKRKHDTETRFFCAAISCMSAGFLTNPIDVVKVRLQLDNQLSRNKTIFENRYYRGFIRGGILILKEEGMHGLLKGVTASLMREGIYSTFRLGFYEPVKGVLGASSRNSPLYKKVIAGAIVGGTGSSIANPTDVVKIRLQGEGNLKKGETPRYRNTYHAFQSIIKREGVLALWRGVGPTVQRAAVLSAAQIPTYDHIKNTIIINRYLDEGLKAHMVASVIAGFVTALATSPFDVVKTRVMYENRLKKYSPTYTNILSCLKLILRTEGILGLYKGFVPNWARIGPHTIITFLIFENLRKYFGLKPI